MERTTDVVAHSPARAGPRVEGPPAHVLDGWVAPCGSV